MERGDVVSALIHGMVVVVAVVDGVALGSETREVRGGHSESNVEGDDDLGWRRRVQFFYVYLWTIPLEQGKETLPQRLV